VSNAQMARALVYWLAGIGLVLFAFYKLAQAF
jgi:hypothetical protein